MGERFRRIAARTAAWMLAIGVVLLAVFSGASLSRSPAAHAAYPSAGIFSVPAGFVGTMTTSWTGTIPGEFAFTVLSGAPSR